METQVQRPGNVFTVPLRLARRANTVNGTKIHFFPPYHQIILHIIIFGSCFFDVQRLFKPRYNGSQFMVF